MSTKTFFRAVVIMPGFFVAAAASAQSTQQVLDTVATYGARQVYNLDFDVPEAQLLGASSPADLRSCKLTSNRGLFCIDAGKNVRNWSNPAAVGAGVVLFNCADIRELDGKSAETCTAITVDPAGNIWLAGKNKGKTHSLLKLTSCPDSGDVGTGDDAYCITLWATGRPLLLDIEFIGTEAGDAFTLGSSTTGLGKGILGLQERKTVVYFPAGNTPPLPGDIKEIGSGKSGWNLAGAEQLQGVTLLQPEGTDDFVLVTTSTGKVRAKNTQTSLVTEFNVLDTSCASRYPQFGIRASAKTGKVYITDRDCKTVSSKTPSYDGVTLSLADDQTIALDVGPEGPTVAAGIGVDLASPACKSEDGCETTPGAFLKVSAGNLVGTASGLTLFQVKDIPDCRWMPGAAACAGKNVIGVTVSDGSCDRDAENKLPPDCLTESVKIVPVTPLPIAPTEAEADQLARGTQYLNVTPLLPAEITDLFPNGLPAILISPQYRACESRDDQGDCVGFVFEAFFGIPEQGVVFAGTIGGEYELKDLIPDERDLTYCKAPGPSDTFADLILWDVATRVSEKFVGVDGLFVDTLINDGCGSITTKKPGWSMVSYGLEVMPHPVKLNNDAVFARLLEKLGAELQYVINELACKPVDTGGSVAPIADCSTLQGALVNTMDKLGKCIEATYQPKQSASNQNCQSFLSQFGAFENALKTAASGCPTDRGSCDPANRLGEVEARTQTLEYVYFNKFVPSVPVGGFCVEADSCAN